MDAEKMIKCGFVKDENNLQFKEVFKNNAKLKEIYIDTYLGSPLASSTSFMLLLRTSEKNVVVANDENRIVLKKNDKFKTHFMNVLFSKIDECFSKVSECCFEFILKIQNIYYKITILN